jgi:protein-tyrosine phosphatase
LEDDTDSSILKHIEDALEWVEKQLQTKNVLIHCHMGISRSASLVLAFLMKNFGMTLDQAFEHTASIRDTIGPNSTFMKELQTYESMLKEKKV